MGLAAPRKRRKIGLDPNNTAWARTGSSYGKKIMSAQGWTPGSYLGARDASQSAHFSAASAAPIRIAPKDDNLGLGARGAGVESDNYGLRSLHDIYGRLNGKSEETRRVEQSHMVNLNLRLYADNKWGGLNFVKGGLLVGDRIHSSLEDDRSTLQDHRVKPATNDGQAEGEPSMAVSEGPSTPASKHDDSPAQQPQIPEKRSSSKKKARRRQKEVSSNNQSDTDPAQAQAQTTQAGDDETETKPGSKEEARRQRKARKEERRRRREDKRTRQDSKPYKDSISEDLDSQGSDVKQDTSRAAAGSRYAVRQRFIKQKRMSSMDPQALREILMITS